MKNGLTAMVPGILGPKELSAAVECYLHMRQSLIDRRPEFEVEAHRAAAAAPADMARRRQKTAAECWRAVWPLPFYSRENVAVAGRRVEAIRANGWFDHFETLAGAADDRDHPWNVERRGRRCSPRGAEAAALCARSGTYAAMPYRTRADVIRRVAQAAALFRNWEEVRRARDISFIDAMTGVDSEAFPRRLFVVLASAIGKVTAFHGLSDLGFRCVKPDIWISRITTSCGWLPGYTPEDVVKNRRGAWEALFETCAQVATAASDHFPSPNALRELDYFVANYGMTFDPKPGDCPCGPAKLQPTSRP
jgi:hypothetical protein